MEERLTWKVSIVIGNDEGNFTDCWKSSSLTCKLLQQSGMFVVNAQHAAIKCAKQCLMLGFKTGLL